MAKTKSPKTLNQGFVIPKKEFRIFTIAALGQNLIYSCMSSYVTDYYVNVLRLAPSLCFCLCFLPVCGMQLTTR